MGMTWEEAVKAMDEGEAVYRKDMPMTVVIKSVAGIYCTFFTKPDGSIGGLPISLEDFPHNMQTATNWEIFEGGKA